MALELEPLLIRLMGDAAHYEKVLAESREHTQRFSKELEGTQPKFKSTFWKEPAADLEKAGEHAHHLAFGMRDTVHAIHLLGATTGLEGVTRPAVQGVHAFHILEHVVTGLVGRFGVLKLAIGGVVGAAGLAAVAIAVHQYEEYRRVIEMTETAAVKGFQSITSGTKSAAAAVQDMRIDTLQEGLNKASEVLKDTGVWRDIKDLSIWTVTGVLPTDQRLVRINKYLEEAATAARNAEIRLRRMFDIPQLAQAAERLATERAMGGIYEGMEKAAKASAALGVRFDELAIHEAAVRLFLTDPKFKTFADALAAIERRAKGVKEAFDTWDMDKLKQDAKDITTKIVPPNVALWPGRMEEENRIREEAVKKGIEPDEAQDRLLQAGVLGALEKTQEANATRELKKQIVDLTFSVQDFGKSEDEIARGKALVEYMKATGASTGDAEKAIGKLADSVKYLKQISEIQKWEEKTRTPAERFAIEMHKLNNLYKTGVMESTVYARSVAMLRHEILEASDVSSNFDAALSGSAEALSRQMEFQERLKTPPGVQSAMINVSAAQSGSAEALSVQMESKNHLANIDKIVAEMAKRDTGMQFAPANFGAVY
jgi:hypothetical protein